MNSILFKFSSKSKFTQNVIKMMTGTVISQGILIITSPILTRLFTPTEFGVYALFLGLSTLISSIATGRYEVAIMLPKSNTDAINLLTLSIIISFITSIVSFVIILFFNKKIATLLGTEDVGRLLYFIPLLVLITGIYQSFFYLNNRHKYFQITANSRVISSSSRSTINILMGYINPNAFGLVIGTVIGQFLSMIYIVYSVINKYKFRKTQINTKRILQLAKKYKKFPIYDTLSIILFTAYKQMNVIVFNKYFTSSLAGFYFMTQRILRIPVSFFVSSFSAVFYQKIAEIECPKQIGLEVNFYMKRIILVGTLPFLLFAYSSYWYVDFVFGEKWVELYKYFFIFSTPTFITLLMSPFSYVLRVINRQDLSLTLHLFKFGSILITLIVVVFFSRNLLGLFFLATVESFVQVIIGLISYYYLLHKLNRTLLISILYIIVLSIINYQIIF